MRSGTADADGDRHTKTTFALHANPSTYRLRPLVTTKKSRVAGTMIVTATTAKTWDPDYKVPLTSEVWVDSIDSNRSIARAAFDMATGNMLQQWKPVQNAANGASTVVVYDARKLFVEHETNELGQLRDFTWEYGTGTKLVTDGPNVRGCVTGSPGCLANDAAFPLKEQNAIRIDGMGRMIERWESFSSDGYIYRLYLVEKNSYTHATATLPASVFHQTLLDTEGTTWMQDNTEVDGHGRPIKQTVLFQAPALANHITSYLYRADGTLQSVSVPNPTLNDGTLVTYTYGFDSLGRPTSFRRPDTASQSGVNLTYGQVGSINSVCPDHPSGNGVMQTATEVLGTAGGKIGATRTTTDSFGRVVRVEEKTDTSTWSSTTYCYGPDGNVKTITDPQLVTTSLEHDVAGRRTKVTRGGNRQWKYTYDANGNMRSEQVPGSDGGLDDLNFITSIDYDDLDRPLSKDIGQRHLSAADQTAFGTFTENFYYDLDTNMAGRLRYWYSYDPAGNWTVGKDFRADIQGRPAGTTHHLRIAGYPELAREIYQSWYAFGPQQHQRTGDVMGAGTNTTWNIYRYDARGLPLQAEIWNLGPGGTTITPVGVQTRNVAGLVTNRRSTMSPGSYVDSNWTYDKLGRVTNQTVQKVPPAPATPTQVVRQELSYFGNDDVKTLRHHLGATNRLFTHEFDFRHQLIGAANTSSYFDANYYYGAAGRLTRARQARTISPPLGADPKLVRDVNYVYSTTEPEQVIALTNVSGGATYASYTYDAAGNQLTRSYPSSNELWEYVYDGKDQLRRVTRKLSGVVTGSEEYWYDEAGQRMAVVKKNASGVNTEMIWFIGDTQAHYNGTGGLTKIYSHVAMGTPLARVERTSDTSASTEFQFHGLASNTIAAVAQDGTINASFSYAPFGQVLEATDGGASTGAGIAAHKRRSNDKIEDDLTGLAYYGARYFDKTLIGWTQADPLYLRVPDAAQLSSPRRANIYMFSLNNALRYVDPDGLDPKMPASGGAMSYRSEKEMSEAGRAANMASEGWTQGCELTGGCDEGEGIPWGDFFGDPSDPCNGVTSVCNSSPASTGAKALARLARLCGPPCARLLDAGRQLERTTDKWAKTFSDAVTHGSSAFLQSLPGLVARTASSSAALGRALGGGFPGQHAHHIVAGNHKLAHAARVVLYRWNIGINDAVNGVWLSEASHKAVHSAANARRYYDMVNLKLLSANSREEVIWALQSIARSIK